jgi:(S)-citramalyl-CoA lyase
MELSLQTLLFTPATQPERFGSALEVRADVLIMDLEDAVAPRDKQIARAQAISALPHFSGTDVVWAIRINGLDTAAGLTDILALLASSVHPALVVLPKAESATHIRLLDRLFTQSGCESKIIGLIESVRAVKDLHEIASSASRLAALMFGAADLAADYGCDMSAPNLDAARIDLVQACVLAGISAPLTRRSLQ